MLKRLFKGFIYFLGFVTLIALICSACTDDEANDSYIEHKDKNQVELVVPDEPDSEVKVVKPEEPTEKFVFIEGPECVMGDFSNNIIGVIQNNSGKDYDYLQITFTIYDAQGNVIDSAFANVNNVKAGGTWRFEAMFFEEEAASWELDEITGW